MKKARALSTICTSVGLGLMLVADPVAAQGAPAGCYARQYARIHLASQPNQVVEAMLLLIRPGGTAFSLRALMANQGHARRDGLGGLVMGEEGACSARDCQVYCDGGAFEFTSPQSDRIEITTYGLRVISGEACGGPARISDLAEVPGQPTTYRLLRSAPSDCRGM